MDSAVRSLRVTTLAEFDQRGNPISMHQYSFFLGENGPFTLKYKVGDDTQEKVTADIDALCQKFRMLGALPGVTY